MKNIFLLLLNFITFQVSAQQCNDDTHSTNSNDSWLSCEVSTNPNPDRGNTHWVVYDLGYNYALGTTTFWNYNVTNQTGFGFKNIAVDYSNDGTNWTAAGTFQLPQASGNPNYQGTAGIDLTGISARYVLITGLNTWDGGSCGGLSEVRFDIGSSPCGDYLVTDNIVSNPVSSGLYYSNESYSSDAIISNGLDVTFKSAVSITLNAGFEVATGTTFLAEIENCESLKTSKNMDNQTQEHNN